MNRIPFNIDRTIGTARAAVLTVRGRAIRTPVFMPVGTQAAIRGTPPWQLDGVGVQILLANTYHLSQRPGTKIIEKAGGVHRFMGTDLPILTDSGGFQVFSLDKKSVDEDGVTFSYEVDGQRTRLTPEISMDHQQKIGADIAMAFDECLPFGVDRGAAERSVDRTTRWERRSQVAHRRPDQSLFGIIQGAFWGDLRRRSAEAITEVGFDGYAIGGLSVGEGIEIMCTILDETLPHLPQDRPRYLMGVGRPIDLVEGVARGIDMFDCVIPTRHARSGVLYTDAGRIRLTDRRYRNDLFPPDTHCDCPTCTTFSRAYLHHLFRVGEILAANLATLHNLRWYARFMASMRQSILEDRFDAFRTETHRIHGKGEAGAEA